MDTLVRHPRLAEVHLARPLGCADDGEAVHEALDVRGTPAHAGDVGVDRIGEAAESLVSGICLLLCEACMLVADDLSLLQDVHPHREALREEIHLHRAEVAQRSVRGARGGVSGAVR